MPNNVEHITLRFLGDTVVEISGNPDVVAQIVSRLDGIEISLTQQYFGSSKNSHDSPQEPSL